MSKWQRCVILYSMRALMLTSLVSDDLSLKLLNETFSLSGLGGTRENSWGEPPKLISWISPGVAEIITCSSKIMSVTRQLPIEVAKCNGCYETNLLSYNYLCVSWWLFIFFLKVLHIFYLCLFHLNINEKTWVGTPKSSEIARRVLNKLEFDFFVDESNLILMFNNFWFPSNSVGESV